MRPGSRPVCSVRAMCVRSRYRRAFSTAVPARRASSSASSTSAASKRRGDSALASVSAPTVAPAAVIGTTSPARMPTLCSSSRCSSSLRGGGEHLVGDLVDDLRHAVADDLRAAGRRRRRPSGSARRAGGRRRPSRGRRGRRRPCGCGRGRRAGSPRTSRRAAGPRARRPAGAWPRSPATRTSSSPARASMRCVISARLTSVMSSMTLTTSLTLPSRSYTPDAFVTRQPSSPVSRLIVCVTSGLGSMPASTCRPGRSSSRSGEPSSLVVSKRSTIACTGVASSSCGECEAEHPRRGLVGVDERAPGVLDRDRLGERRERDRELGLDRLELGEQAGVVERERGAAGEHLARTRGPRRRSGGPSAP